MKGLIDSVGMYPNVLHVFYSNERRQGVVGRKYVERVLVPLFHRLASTVFWIVMLVDCATKETSQGNEKLVWILIILFTHWIGALIYFLVRRPRRIAERRARLARQQAS